MRTLSDRMFTIARQLGHHIVAWDEEGLVRLPDAEYFQRRLSAKAVRMVSQLYCWGPDNARAFRAFPATAGIPIYETGNPRIDLLRPEIREFYRADADALNDRYGDFILINSNFGQVNHFYEHLGDLKAAAEGKDTPWLNDYEIGRGKFKLAMFGEFKAMLPKLAAAFPERTIVLRPHPSENHQPWLDAAKDCPNVRVIHEQAIMPWLMACAALVSNGCTTAIEAAILGARAVNYHPFRSEFDLAITRDVAPIADSLDQLIDMIGRAVTGALDPLPEAERRAVLDAHISALDGKFAFERMVDALVEGGYRESPPPPSPLPARIVGKLHNMGRTQVKLRRMRRAGNRNSAEFHAHRFPDIGVEQMQARVDRFNAVTGGRFAGLQVKPHSEFLFKVEAS
jgi:surface carbohydrate biosynthesis protein